MASFVSEILKTAGQMETQEVHTKLKHLTKKTDSLKMQLQDATTNKHTNLMPKLHSIETLIDNVESMKAEMADVSNRIEHQIKGQLNMSTAEYQTLSSQMEEVSSVLTVLEKLVTLQDGLETVEKSIGLKEYSDAAENLLVLNCLLSKRVHSQEGDIQILDAIKTEISMRNEELISELLAQWRSMIQWVVPDKQIKTHTVVRKYELRLHVKGDNSSMLDKIVVAMEKINILNEEMQKLFERVQRFIVDPLMSGGYVAEESEGNQEKVLTIKLQDDAGDQKPLVPMTLFENLDVFQRFLNHNLLHRVVSHLSDAKSTPVTLLTYFRDLFGDKVLNQSVKECLIPSIPRNNKELNEFQNVITITEEFHRQWMEIGLIRSDSTVLLDFVENVNVLFANKKCQEIMEEARKLMTSQEMHNSVLVTHDHPLGELPPLIKGQSEGKKGRKFNVETPLSSNTLRLPSCKISSPIQEVMVIAYETLHEAASSSEQTAIQMFFSVRYLFELFCGVVPASHKQSLETLPQFTALHYNNCMYISHHLMTLGHQFSAKLQQTSNVTFVDLVPKVRQLGTRYFLQQLVRQGEQISEYLNGDNGFLNISQNESFLSSERAMKQILHQLQHLKIVWQDVLPPSNYRKAIGGLVNNVVVEIVDSIVTLEDFSADDTKLISKLLNVLTDKVPDLFELPGDKQANSVVELQRNVSKWQRFKELDLILSSSMMGIVDRWAGGKGPLAVAFTAIEVKQMIRALFQNTDRRSAMLAKIK